MTDTQRLEVTLHRASADGIGLIEAATAVLGDGPAVAMAYGRRPELGRYHHGAIHGPDGPINLDDIYRADLFIPDVHLRWYRPQGAGLPRAAVLSEHTPAAPGFGPGEALACLALDQRYLLWPAPEPHAVPGPLPAGWSWAGSARTATFAVPIDQPPGLRTALEAREYVVIDPTVIDKIDGNTYVVDERYIALAAFTPPSSPAREPGGAR